MYIVLVTFCKKQSTWAENIYFLCPVFDSYLFKLTSFYKKKSLNRLIFLSTKMTSWRETT